VCSNLLFRSIHQLHYPNIDTWAPSHLPEEIGTLLSDHRGWRPNAERHRRMLKQFLDLTTLCPQLRVLTLEFGYYDSLITFPDSAITTPDVEPLLISLSAFRQVFKLVPILGCSTLRLLRLKTYCVEHDTMDTLRDVGMWLKSGFSARELDVKVSVVRSTFLRGCGTEEEHVVAWY